MNRQKPPLTPRQAIIMSIAIFFISSVLLFIAWLFYYVPWNIGDAVYLGVLYLGIGFSWASLSYEGRNAVIHGHNRLTYTAVLIIILLLFIQQPYEQFPTWGIIIILLVGSIGYSNIAIYAVRNFVSWKQGKPNN